FGVASALSLALLLICVLAVYFYRHGTRNTDAFATVTGKGYAPTSVRLGRWRWPVSLAIGVMFAFALGLPLVTLAWQSVFRNLAPPLLSSAAEANLANYEFILTYPIFLAAVKTSILLAATAATLLRVIAYVTLYMPYGMRFASSGLAQIHRELEEAAQVAGARLGQVFARILLPLLAPVLLAAWIYVFVLAVRELGASVFLVGPGTHVLGTITLTMWEEGGSYGAVSALGVLQILPLLVIVAVLRWLEIRVH